MKVVRQFQGRRIESRSIAAAGELVKSELMTGKVTATVQQDDHRPFLPGVRATV